jgi:resuscitation-promoting factor RpfA
MRLVCPNCDAKYEVPEDAIPETGRDVQCANCGHAWFQMRSRAAEAAAVATPVAAPVAPIAPAPPAPEPVVEAPPAPVEPEPVETAEVGPVVEPVPDVPVVETAMAADPDPAEPEVVEPVADVADEAPVVDAEGEVSSAETVVAAADVETATDEMESVPEPVADSVAATVADSIVGAEAATEDADDAMAEDSVDIPASTGAIAAAGVAAYAVDDSVLAILREEAEREAHARKADTAKPLETQTDLGLDAAIPAMRKGQAEVQSDPVSGDETLDDRQAIRRTRLPDVEEINSTLRPSELTETEAEAAAMVPVAEGRSSFRSGFLLVLTLAILASAIYGSADAISSAVPALEGPLKGFVGFIDSLRLQLDGLMQSATVAIGSN